MRAHCVQWFSSVHERKQIDDIAPVRKYAQFTFPVVQTHPKKKTHTHSKLAAQRPPGTLGKLPH